MGRARTVVVIPAGPRDDVVDTVAGVLTYIGESRHVVVLDDTRGLRPDEVRYLAGLDDVSVLAAVGGGEGTFGSLWVKLGRALSNVLSEWEFDLLLRLDADAQLIGPGLPEAALERFRAEADLGLLGSYRTTSDGSERDFQPARRLLRQDIALRNVAVDRSLRAEVLRLRRMARRHGYEDGEHVLGACSLLTHSAVAAMDGIGALRASALGRSVQGDDHLMGLAVRAAGLRIGDLGGPGQPVAVRWKGLPAHPEELLRRGVAATHSVRSWQELDETAVRAVFRDAREEWVRSTGHPAGG